MYSVFSWNPNLVELLLFQAALRGVSQVALSAALGVRTNQLTKVLAEPDADSATRILEEAAEFLQFEPHRLDLEEASALKGACDSWSLGHGALLRLHVERANAGFLSEEEEKLLSSKSASFRRWFGATVSPRPEALMPVLFILGVSPKVFQNVEPEGVSPRESRNRFAYALKSLREDLGLSNRELSESLSVGASALQTWIDGRSYPEPGPIRERLEYALGVKVEDVKAEEQLDSFIQAPEGFARCFQKARLDKGLTLAQLSEISGVSSGTLRSWESGTRDLANFAVQRRVADALELDYDVFSLMRYGPQPMGSFSERLRAYRLLRLLSPSEMAKALGIDAASVQAYRNYEMGRFPGYTLTRVEEFAQILEVSVDDLFNPDRTAFARWLRNEVDDSKPLSLMALVAGVTEPTIQEWVNGESWPQLEQAEALGKLCGVGSIYARTLITG